MDGTADLLVQAALAAMESRDPGAWAHAQQVATLAERIAVRVGFDRPARRTIRYAGLLHDIGKLAVRDAILGKPGPLTPNERAEIEKHPVYGGFWLVAVPALRPCIPGVLYHHERWDGSGYPDHLVGRDIPLAARILAIADVYAALTSDRVYQKAWPMPQALALINAQSGGMFDPAIAAVLLQVITIVT